ncbi:MAG: HAD family hydrolase [Patescibacteria group bacterium]|nr:HAD family hydrolase [Patescibacteria group bacterium]
MGKRQIEGLRPAVFLDRDGTVIRYVENLVDPRQVELLPHAAEAIADLNHRGFLVFIATNQPMIEKKMLTPSNLEEIHDALRKQLAANGAHLDGIYVCPHQFRPSGQCECRKPGIKMVRDAKTDFPISVPESWFVGDRLRDIETGKRAGMKTILLATGGDNDDDGFFAETHPDFEAADLKAAVKIITPSP